MEWKIIRRYNKDTYCIGDFYVDGVKICSTLEDRDRGLCQSMTLTDINNSKVYGKTAIPTGEYVVSFDVVPEWSTMRKFIMCARHGYRFPRINNVKGYSGVFIHNGATDKDTLGCPLVGRNTVKGMLTDSKTCIDILMNLAQGNKYMNVTLIIKREYER